MSSESEHTNRQRSPQQAQGRQWPILVLLLGLAALALALTACGGPSSTSTPDATSATRVPSTSTPDATSATRVPEWEETVTFSVKWLDVHLVDIPLEKCEQVIFHLVSSKDVSVLYLDASDRPDGEIDGWVDHTAAWGRQDDFRAHKATEESGIWTLIVRHYGHQGEITTPTDVTVSYRVEPYSQGFCFPTG